MRVGHDHEWIPVNARGTRWRLVDEFGNTAGFVQRLSRNGLGRVLAGTIDNNSYVCITWPFAAALVEDEL